MNEIKLKFNQYHKLDFNTRLVSIPEYILHIINQQTTYQSNWSKLTTYDWKYTKITDAVIIFPYFKPQYLFLYSTWKTSIPPTKYPKKWPGSRSSVSTVTRWNSPSLESHHRSLNPSKNPLQSPQTTASILFQTTLCLVRPEVLSDLPLVYHSFT